MREKLAGRLAAQAVTETGVITLREVPTVGGIQYELRINGIYAMATYSEESESELARIALDALGERPGARVLIGGLGVGYTLREVLNASWIGAVTVVEIEPVVLTWCREYFSPYNGHALDDARVNVIIEDIGGYIRRVDERFDAILLDMDNGPDQLILERNAPLYTDESLRLWREHLTPGGVLAIWAAKPDEAFETRLRRVFPHVEMHRITTGLSVRTPWPDAVYCARRELLPQ